jgi:hypothetical protein
MKSIKLVALIMAFAVCVKAGEEVYSNIVGFEGDKVFNVIVVTNSIGNISYVKTNDFHIVEVAKVNTNCITNITHKVAVNAYTPHK